MLNWKHCDVLGSTSRNVIDSTTAAALVLRHVGVNAVVAAVARVPLLILAGLDSAQTADLGGRVQDVWATPIYVTDMIPRSDPPSKANLQRDQCVEGWNFLQHCT